MCRGRPRPRAAARLRFFLTTSECASPACSTGSGFSLKQRATLPEALDPDDEAAKEPLLCAFRIKKLWRLRACQSPHAVTPAYIAALSGIAWIGLRIRYPHSRRPPEENRRPKSSKEMAPRAYVPTPSKAVLDATLCCNAIVSQKQSSSWAEADSVITVLANKHKNESAPRPD